MPVTIRSANEQDLPFVFLLIREFALFQGAPQKVTITPAQLMQDRALFHCFVAEAEQDGIIGFATCFVAYYSWSGKAVYLDDLYVKETFRQQGIGKKLLQAIIHFAEEQNCKKVRWQVSKWNTPAIAFYKSMGAVVDDVEINCDLLLPTTVSRL